jgi:methylmalonyl-CoA/ethylmalonyl-CoA epimerase
MASAKKAAIKQVLQVGMVVKDLQKAMERYWNIFGIGPWDIYTFQPPAVTNMTLRGKPVVYTMKLAVTQIGNIQWELIEPLTGPSIYKEFLEQKGEGIHHVACDVGEYDQAVATMAKHGIGILMSGSTPADSYAYMDTEEALGTVLEIYNRSADFEMPPPEATYPPSA